MTKVRVENKNFPPKGKINPSSDSFTVNCACPSCNNKEFAGWKPDGVSIAEAEAVFLDRGWKTSGSGKKTVWWCRYCVYKDEFKNTIKREVQDALLKALAGREVTFWTMSFSGTTMAGGFSHVSGGEELFLSEESCQEAIDNMKGWIGMGSRDRYRPLALIFNKKER